MNAPHLNFIDNIPISRHSKSFKERCKEIRNKWKLVKLMMGKEESRSLLHPVMVHLGWRMIRVKSNRNLSVGQKISQKYRFYQPMPRFRPFACSKCALSSHNLVTIKAHNCRRRKRRELNQEEIQKAIDNGHKSGLRNPLRTMESIDNPSKFVIEKLNVEYQKNLGKERRITRQRIPKMFRESSSDLLLPVFTNSKENSGEILREKEVCYICLNCGGQYQNYKEFDDHLYVSDNCANPNNDMTVIVENHSFPLNYTKISKDDIIKDDDLRCLGCQKTDFEDMVQLQTHALQCNVQY
ncbi:unnamed protein product [Bursaphelenchus xylophilus]|uniref:(pine wood nematode) hypothetical protein n=1 Tax=Bursaphelenchus xylophilus TaxID=6326 RepID=A0A1I7RPH6_BURXY|nr:unnamed protein product [Bursaphelenchus xylophilus]CAG9096034.1 unnamed protein product [Bursaphelenchus xylophilus]